MPTITLVWTEVINVRGRLHSTYTAKSPDGTGYRIWPVFYRSNRFAGYRITAGSVRIRGFKTTLHDAKASAQRFANRERNATIKTVTARARGKRALDLDFDTIEITRPVMTGRNIDLD